GQLQRRQPAGPERSRHQKPRLRGHSRLRPGADARRRGCAQRRRTPHHGTDGGRARMIYSRIVGTGGYLPPRVVTNDELSKKLDTSDSWIQERTGIRQRHIADESQASSDLALEASRRALAAAGVNAADIDLIVVATSTPDFIFPSTACLLQAK